VTKSKTKSKMGRPSKGDEARTVSIIVKVSKKELKLFRDAAGKAGIPLGPWLIQHRRGELGR